MGRLGYRDVHAPDDDARTTFGRRYATNTEWGRGRGAASVPWFEEDVQLLANVDIGSFRDFLSRETRWHGALDDVEAMGEHLRRFHSLAMPINEG